MSDGVEIYNSETKDALALVEKACGLMLIVPDLKEIAINHQQTATSYRPEVCIEIRVKR